MRIVFMGTPYLASVCLETILTHPQAEVVGVVTQTDKPKGRGMKLCPSPVKALALERGLPVFQPVTFRENAFAETLAALDPELILVAAYGKILPEYVLSYARCGCINAHGSLLPKYRGASPIQRAILEGETVSGITAMVMDAGIDTGDMLFTEECPITDTDDAGTLTEKLALLAGKALYRVIDCALDGTLAAMRRPQPETGATYAAKITKDDQWLDFSLPARQISCQIRGLSPAPLALTHTPDDKLLKLTGACVTEEMTDAPCGTVVALGKEGFTVACGDGKTVLVTGVVPEGKGKMSAADFVRGRKIAVGDVLYGENKSV